MALRSAYWALHRKTDSLFTEHDVTAHQYVILSILYNHPQITQSELVTLASSDPNTIRAILVKLEKKRLVVRKPHPRDRRAWQVNLTPMGRRTFEKLTAVSKPLREHLSEQFNDRDRKRILAQLQTISNLL